MFVILFGKIFKYRLKIIKYWYWVDKKEFNYSLVLKNMFLVDIYFELIEIMVLIYVM